MLRVGSESFAAGKGTALIVDVGSDLVSVVPVCDGYAIRSGEHRSPNRIFDQAPELTRIKRSLRSIVGTKRQPLSLTLLNSQIENFLTHSHSSASLLPHHLIRSRKPVGFGQPPQVQWNQARLDKTTDSWKSYWKNKVVDGWREGCAEVMLGGYSLE